MSTVGPFFLIYHLWIPYLSSFLLKVSEETWGSCIALGGPSGEPAPGTRGDPPVERIRGRPPSQGTRLKFLLRKTNNLPYINTLSRI